jgi:hypothetical protein
MCFCRPNVQRLASDLLVHPIRINVGKIGAVNKGKKRKKERKSQSDCLLEKDIDQIAIVLGDEAQKQMWLLAKLPQFVKVICLDFIWVLILRVLGFCFGFLFFGVCGFDFWDLDFGFWIWF